MIPTILHGKLWHNDRDGVRRALRSERSALAHSRAGRSCHVHGRRAAAVFWRDRNLPTPDYIKQAAIQALADGYTFYTENAGLPSLRRAIAHHYQKLHGVDLDPESEIVITASGVQALNVSLRCDARSRR